MITHPVSAPAIDRFRGEWRWLSNFAPAEVEYAGTRYPTVEHAYQAAKTDDPALQEQVRLCPTPGQAKRLGRQLVLRAGFEDAKVAIMHALLRQKFSREPLRSKLLRTGSAHIAEGNDWGDTFWGVCRGQGRNMLGELIMAVRSELRAASGTCVLGAFNE